MCAATDRRVAIQAPVHFTLDDSPNGGAGGLRVRARNKNTFASTANLLLGYRVLLDGAPLIVGDPAQRDVSGWYPGGSVAIAPQVHHPMRTGVLQQYKWSPACAIMVSMGWSYLGKRADSLTSEAAKRTD